MKFKKIVACAITCAMSVSLLVGCGETKAPSSKPAAKGESKVIKVGMEVAYPPFEFYEDDGKTITGIDYDLANAIGDKLGCKMEFVPVSWDGIFAGLDKGDYDVIMSAITITPERAEKYSFSTPYMKNYQCIVTKTNATNKPTGIAGLNGLNVGYQEESTSDIMITDAIQAGTVTCKTNEYNKIMDAFLDLKADRLDAIVCDSTVADEYTIGGSYGITWKQEDNPEEFAVCFPKDSGYVEEFNNALKSLENSGKLKDILEKYL